MTEPICSATSREKLWSSEDDQPPVCAERSTKTAPGPPDKAIEACGTNLDCVLETLHQQNGSRPPNFGAFANPSYEAPDDRGMAGARGSGSGPPLEDGALPLREPPPRSGRGPGIALGVQASAAAGGGPGLAASIEVGIMLHEGGLSAYVTDTKLPTHCNDNQGEPRPCSQGVGATAGVGLAGHIVIDGDAAEGDGRAATLDTPVGSIGMSYLDDGKTVTSLDVGIGPSVGASARVDDTNTTFYPILSGRF